MKAAIPSKKRVIHHTNILDLPRKGFKNYRISEFCCEIGYNSYICEIAAQQAFYTLSEMEYYSLGGEVEVLYRLKRKRL
jgi:hypothetical protein